MKIRYSPSSFIAFLVGGLTVGVIMSPTAVMAQAVKTLTISPLTFELTANAGETISNVLKIYNNNDFNISANIDVEDFAPAGETGQAVVTEPQEDNTYSLARWITVEEETFEIEAQNFRPITFHVNVPLNAEPGGHYGTVLASIADGGGEGGVSVASKVGALLLLQVAGTAKESLNVASMGAPNFSEYGPVTIATRFQNTGTVHLKPRGFILVQNMFGQETAKLNLDQKNVLPNSVRRIESKLDEKWLWGKYTATLTAIYGSTNEPLSYTTTFWVIPWRVSLAVGLILLIVFIILYRARRRIFLALKILLKGEHS